MKILLLVGIVVISCIALLVACRRRNSIQGEAKAAVSEGRYQFIALMDDDGKVTYPRVPEIPEWYFQTTGLMVRTVKPDTLAEETAHIKVYNDALYQELKRQGKFHHIQENMARVRTNLDNYEKSKKSN